MTIEIKYEELEGKEFFSRAVESVETAKRYVSGVDKSQNDKTLVGETALQAFWGMPNAIRTSITGVSSLVADMRAFFLQLAHQSKAIDVQNENKMKSIE